MRFAAAFTILVLATGFAIAEDKVTLKDGKVVTGTILEVTTADVQVDTDGGKVRVPRVVIEKAERDGKPLDLAAAAAAATPKPPPEPPPVARVREFEATPALLAWLDVCAGQLAADDEGIRAGASAALLAAGPVAIPVLEAASKRDERIARMAGRVIAQIQRQQQRMLPTSGSAAKR